MHRSLSQVILGNADNVKETLYSALLASPSLLAAYESDGQLKSLCWPRKDAFHNHLRFCIMGIVQNGKSIWLDPKRDQLSMEWIHPLEHLQLRWHVHHPDARGLRIYLQAKLINDSIIEHSYSIEADELSGLHHTQFWFLLVPEVGGQRSQFQCVRARQSENTLKCDADPFTLTLACTSAEGFKYAAAAQLDGDNDLGALISDFVRHPAAFRRIEMGSCAAVALSPVIPWNHKYTLHLRVHDRNKTRTAPSQPQTPRSHQSFSLAVLDALTCTGGGLLASAECDWDMRHSGGYGFIWPRDAAFAGLALAECGHWERASKLGDFLSVSLAGERDFEQRYTDSGHPAPSWCVTQPDQRPLVCLFWIKLLQSGKLETNVHEKLTSQLNVCLTAMADELLSTPKKALSGFDLWEEREGQHFFAIVSCYGALRRGARFATTPETAARYEQAAQAAAALANEFFSDNHSLPARTRHPDGTLDFTPDASLLACLYPVPEFPLPQEIKLNIFLELRKKLAFGCGYRRYPNDPYRSGGCWPLVGLWFGLSLESLEPPPSSQPTVKAILHQAAAASNSLGLLPEQVDPHTGEPSWIVPLGWSHAFFLQLSHRLQLNSDPQKILE